MDAIVVSAQLVDVNVGHCLALPSSPTWSWLRSCPPDRYEADHPSRLNAPRFPSAAAAIARLIAGCSAVVGHGSSLPRRPPVSSTGLPQPTPRARSPLVAAAIAAALVLCLGSSCGSDDETIGGTTTTQRSTTSVRGTSSSGVTTSPTTSTDSSTSAPTSDPAADPAADPAHQEIIDAYVGYWDARFAANSGVPNPQDRSATSFALDVRKPAVCCKSK